MLLESIVFLHVWLDVKRVQLINLADDGGENLTDISHDREGEGDPDDSKEDAKNTTWKGDWRNIPIANSSDDGGGEED